jgi:hypothetical protein
MICLERLYKPFAKCHTKLIEGSHMEGDDCIKIRTVVFHTVYPFMQEKKCLLKESKNGRSVCYDEDIC